MAVGQSSAGRAHNCYIYYITISNKNPSKILDFDEK